MKSARIYSLIFATLAFVASCSQLFAQGTAFTYQGRLNNNGSPVNGSFDLTFTLFNTNSSGVAVAGPVTNSATVVSNGLFTTTIDFGAGVFTGTNNWLEIAVQTNGGGDFTTLAPRQQVTPTPYAIYSAHAGSATTATTAGSATSATSATTATTANSFSGSLAGDVTGTQGATVVSTVGGQSAAIIAGGAAAANAATSANNPNTIVQRDASGNFNAGAITANSFSGDGAGLTNLNASSIASGTIPAGVLTSGATNLPGHLLVVTGGTRQVTYNGQSLTNIQGSNVVGALQASQLVGTIPDQLLSSNVALLNGTNVFSGTNSFTGPVIVTNGASQFSGTFNGNLNGNAATATSATSATTATTANNFSGSLAGDVTGTQGATVVSSVGGQSAASVAIGAAAANAATNVNTPNTIVQRDASGNFVAGTITGNLAGNATTATTATNVVGNIADSQLSSNVALLNGTNVFSGSNSFTGPVIITNGANQFGGTFNGTVIGSTTITNNYTNFSGSLNGDVTGIQGATVVSTVGGQSAASVASGAVAANGAASAGTPNTIVRRDASGNFIAGTITAANLAVTNFSTLGMATNSQTNIVVNGSFPFAIGNGEWNAGNFPQPSPVAILRPVGTVGGITDQGMVLDLMPNGTNQQPVWMDICSSDFYVNSLNVISGEFLHLQKDASGDGHIALNQIGGFPYRSLDLQDESSSQLLYIGVNHAFTFNQNSTGNGDVPSGSQTLQSFPGWLGLGGGSANGAKGVIIAYQQNNGVDASALEITNTGSAALAGILKLMKGGGWLFSGAGTNSFTGLVTATNGIASMATNAVAAASSFIGTTNVSGYAQVWNVSGTSGNIIFYNRAGSGGTTVASTALWTNTITASGEDIVVGQNCGIAITSGVGVVGTGRAF